MIVAVCADKGSPGVTTAALALATVWPGPRVLLEADPAGGDLALWLRDPAGEPLQPRRSVLDLAADARVGLPPEGVAAYAEASSLGVPVVKSRPAAEEMAPAASLWPRVAERAQEWPGAVIADLGRVQRGHAAFALAASASVVLLVTRMTAGSLYRLRAQAADLAASLGQGPAGRSPVAVLPVAPDHHRKQAAAEVRQVLDSEAATTAVPVAGCLAEDSRGVALLLAGYLGRRLDRAPLMQSAREVPAAVEAWTGPEGEAPPPTRVLPPRRPASDLRTTGERT